MGKPGAVYKGACLNKTPPLIIQLRQKAALIIPS